MSACGVAVGLLVGTLLLSVLLLFIRRLVDNFSCQRFFKFEWQQSLIETLHDSTVSVFAFFAHCLSLVVKCSVTALSLRNKMKFTCSKRSPCYICIARAFWIGVTFSVYEWRISWIRTYFRFRSENELPAFDSSIDETSCYVVQATYKWVGVKRNATTETIIISSRQPRTRNSHNYHRELLLCIDFVSFSLVSQVLLYLCLLIMNSYTQ